MCVGYQGIIGSLEGHNAWNKLWQMAIIVCMAERIWALKERLLNAKHNLGITRMYTVTSGGYGKHGPLAPVIGTDMMI